MAKDQGWVLQLGSACESRSRGLCRLPASVGNCIAVVTCIRRCRGKGVSGHPGQFRPGTPVVRDENWLISTCNLPVTCMHPPHTCKINIFFCKT